MEWTDLKDVVFFQEGPGVRKHQYRTSGIKLLNVANLQNGKVDLSTSDRYISEDEAYGKYNHFMVDEGDLIIASSGIKVEYFEKKMGFIDSSHLPLCMNTSTIRFKSLDSEVLNIYYFAYFLKTIYFKKQIARLITGSAQLNFGPSHLKQIKLPLPPLPTQRKIVEVLDKAQSLIDKRKEQIKLLDELIQSTFYDMFGDPVKNDMGWEVRKLIESCIKITDGTHQSPKWADNGIPFIFVSNINNGKISYNTNKYISKEEYMNLIKRTPIEIGDILYTTVGSYGNPAVIREVKKFCFQRHIAYIKPNQDIINPNFIEKLMMSIEFKRMVDRKVRGVAQKTLNLSDLKNFNTIIPPIELQNQFAQKVEKIEEQKAKLNESLKLMEDNFHSLMQRAFRGEL